MTKFSVYVVVVEDTEDALLSLMPLVVEWDRVEGDLDEQEAFDLANSLN